jgi:hypothetical protein
MRTIVYSSFAAALLMSGGTASAQKIIGPEKAQVQPPVSVVQVQPPGIRNAQLQPPGIHVALAASGKFNTFLAIVKAAGMDDWERGSKTGFTDELRGSQTGFTDELRGGKAGFTDELRTGKAGIQDDSVRGVTVLAPNDAAFAAMDQAKLKALMTDQAAARAFVMAHVVGTPLKVADMFDAGNLNSEKNFKAVGGGELKLLCNGRHDGMHHPRINGVAKVGDVQDVGFAGGIVQEIDAVLVK